jgi:hypothetical protein
MTRTILHGATYDFGGGEIVGAQIVNTARI